MSSSTLFFFFIHVKGKYLKIEIKSILYVTSIAHHVKLVTDKGVYLPHLSLKQLETILPADTFCRVNRGTLINLDRVVSYDKDSVYLKDVSFSFGEKYKKIFEGKIVLLIHKE